MLNREVLTYTPDQAETRQKKSKFHRFLGKSMILEVEDFCINRKITLKDLPYHANNFTL
ncbi:hypothetical protein NIES4073_32980 [Kalymmatonema gypsitolerans NIES-4073]|nr:hypothetical protein NIES4073_32980 [Scytonema sp. NIES-4073]